MYIEMRSASTNSTAEIRRGDRSAEQKYRTKTGQSSLLEPTTGALLSSRLDRAPATIGVVLLVVGYGSCLLQLAGVR